jgi:hypothetical protein
MKPYLAIGLACALIGGCGNKSEPKTAPPAPLAARQDAQPGVVPPPPGPPNAVDDGMQRPTPGQANDHSTPEFKDGGKSDPKK